MNMSTSGVLRSVALIVFVALLPLSARGETSSEQWFIGPRIGLSGFTGFIGLETQRNHWGFALGFPYTIGLRYYFQIPKHSWFTGAFQRTYYSYYDSPTGLSKENKYHENGIGGGHRWRWKSGWDLELDFTVGYGTEQELIGLRRKGTYLSLRPGIAFGYSF
ncbi:MAG: hypothetical protein IPP68_07560 [Elusimicrobia bacterium]|nr:hypothetical protein [Elusimicrobiota bacterium]